MKWHNIFKRLREFLKEEGFPQSWLHQVKSGQGCVCCVWRSPTGPGKSKWWSWAWGEEQGRGWKETVSGFLQKRKRVFQNVGDLSSGKGHPKCQVRISCWWGKSFKGREGLGSREQVTMEGADPWWLVCCREGQDTEKPKGTRSWSHACLRPVASEKATPFWDWGHPRGGEKTEPDTLFIWNSN